jgi:pimeloyl-ACP methyl ester carboxylesterase
MDLRESSGEGVLGLLPILRGVRVVEFPSLGHMAPITHPDVVNAEIARFLSKV